MNEMMQETDAVEDAEVVTDESTPEDVAAEIDAAYSEDRSVNDERQQIEEQARAFGWKSPDEWQGEKPSGYIDDPQAYLDRLENFTPFRKQREQFEAKQREWEDKFRRLDAMQEQALERQRAQLQAQMQDIAAGKRRAVEEADTDAYTALEQRERMMAQQYAQMMQQPPQPQGPPPEVASYVQANEWAKDPALWEEAAQAIDYNPEIQKKPASEQLAYAESVMRRKYPHLFEQPKQRPQRQMVDSGGLAGGQRKSEFDKLPAEAKQQFKRFVEKGLFTDDTAGKKEYVDAYNEV